MPNRSNNPTAGDHRASKQNSERIPLTMTQRAGEIGLVPLTPAIGAELTGIELSTELSGESLSAIHAALMQHQVVFFRNQHIEPWQQVDFARKLGRLRIAQRAAFELVDGIPEMALIVNDQQRPPNVNHYHTDGIFRREPEFASMLRAIEVPPSGGDTIFVSLHAAYEALDDAMKSYLEDKHACNDFMKLHGSPKKRRSWEDDNRARMEEMCRQNPSVVHPLVRTHPVTGRKSLYVSESFTTHIVDEDAARSTEVLSFLFRHYERPEFQCRFCWQPDSIALWDNRATLHYAVADYWPAKRLMHRLTIETDALGEQSNKES